jgi:hypothetical protein
MGVSVSSFEQYKEVLNNPPVIIPFIIGGTSVGGRSMDTWPALRLPTNTAPAAAIQLFSSSTGTIYNVSNELTILGCNLSPHHNGTEITLIDRLCHSGGLNATSVAAQTTNLPTADLPRYTDSIGVMAGIFVLTQIGTTATTVTVSYVNNFDVSATSQPIQIGATGFREAGRLFIIPFQNGELGIKKVLSVTLALSTGTAGDIGVVLFKPLCSFLNTANQSRQNPCTLINGNMVGGMAKALQGAHLSFITVGEGSSFQFCGSIIAC